MFEKSAKMETFGQESLAKINTPEVKKLWKSYLKLASYEKTNTQGLQIIDLIKLKMRTAVLSMTSEEVEAARKINFNKSGSSSHEVNKNLASITENFLRSEFYQTLQDNTMSEKVKNRLSAKFETIETNKSSKGRLQEKNLEKAFDEKSTEPDYNSLQLEADRARLEKLMSSN